MNDSDLVREKQINVRLNPEELERLGRVARHYGLSGPNALRVLLKREDDRLQAEAAAAAVPAAPPVTPPTPKSRKR
jgi:hypothetical protein